jgi:predicted secreted acid phosphatase
LDRFCPSFRHSRHPACGQGSAEPGSFITGRPEPQRDATERNLRAQGYESWQQLFLRQPDQGSQPTIAYKSAARAKIVAQGYKIVLSAGDQWSDLKGTPEAEFSVKYPNPFYYIP